MKTKISMCGITIAPEVDNRNELDAVVFMMVDENGGGSSFDVDGMSL